MVSVLETSVSRTNSWACTFVNVLFPFAFFASTQLFFCSFNLFTRIYAAYMCTSHVQHKVPSRLTLMSQSLCSRSFDGLLVWTLRQIFRLFFSSWSSLLPSKKDINKKDGKTNFFWVWLSPIRYFRSKRPDNDSASLRASKSDISSFRRFVCHLSQSHVSMHCSTSWHVTSPWDSTDLDKII